MARVIASQHTKQHTKKRPGVHSKCKNSNSKKSKHYKTFDQSKIGGS